MPIERLELLAGDLVALREFYGGRFGLAVALDTTERVEFQVGTTRLAFAQAPMEWAGRYHFAFNIPNNQFADAKMWLAERVALATDAAGNDVFHSDDWDADNLYYFDPAGNIGELIARHTLDCAADAPFGAASLLAVSEIGLAAPNVPAAVADLTAQLGIATYGEASETFWPIGDERGLFIVVRTGRIWFPETGLVATPLPLAATVRDGQGPGWVVRAEGERVVVEAEK